MATRKKTTTESIESDRRAFAVVLEELHAKFDVFGEALQGVRSDVAELKVDVAELKVDVAELKVDVAELKLMRPQIDALRDDVELLKVAVLDNVREIKQLRKAR